MKIRKAQLSDIEEVLEHSLVLLKQHSDLDPYFTPTKTAAKTYRKFLERSLDAEDSLFLVSEKDEKLIGYAVGEIHKRSPIFEIAEYGYINDVFVIQEYRKHGIAKMFLRELKDWFKIKKLMYIELSVHAKNEIGKTTWKKFGFNAYEIKKAVSLEDFIV